VWRVLLIKYFSKAKKNLIFRMYQLEDNESWLEFLNKLKLLEEQSCISCRNFYKQIHGYKIRFQDRDSSEVSIPFQQFSKKIQ
jgi:hypothetical protein